MKVIARAILGFAFGISWSIASAQGAGGSNLKLQGVWSLTSVVNEQGGNRYEPYGPHPKGQFIFDGIGRYSIILLRPDLPKFASNDRVKGTPDENAAVVTGSLVHFGTYKVNDTGDGYTLNIEGSTFANWTGAQQERRFSIVGDELRITNPSVYARRLFLLGPKASSVDGPKGVMRPVDLRIAPAIAAGAHARRTPPHEWPAFKQSFADGGLWPQVGEGLTSALGSS